MLYVGLAILLGTVTMVAPLAVLGPNETIPDTRNGDIPEFIVTAPEETEPSVEGNVLGMNKTLEAGNYSIQTTTPEPEPVIPMEPSESATVPEVSPTDIDLGFRKADNPSDLSSIGLLTVPSFLVALGVFVYLRKRIS